MRIVFEEGSSKEFMEFGGGEARFSLTGIANTEHSGVNAEIFLFFDF